MQTNTRSNVNGFTLVELIITVGVISVVMVGATAVMPGMLKASRADGSAMLVLNTLRLARDRAISERRNMQLIFTAPNHIQVAREEITVPATVPVTTTVIMNVYLENGQKFLKFTELADTPDQFGLVNSPLAFGPTQGTAPTIMFTSEGTLMDPSGDSINGTVFIGTAGNVTSARAITIFGPTALVRVWRWDGRRWAE
jgi:prepilin-type N-terminal cleavage/methylation domain-containing protein